MTYDGKPVSLRPMKFKDAVKELLKAKPEPGKPKGKKRTAPESHNVPVDPPHKGS
jgi:hypothetical protein